MPVGGSIYTACTPCATVTAGLPGMGCLLAPPEMPPKESKRLGTRLQENNGGFAAAESLPYPHPQFMFNLRTTESEWDASP